MLHVVSQGRTKAEAYEMIADAIESLVNKEGFEVQVYPAKGECFEIGASDEAALIAFLLRQARTHSGLSLAQVAKQLGAKSLNAFARYEQGRSSPTMQKFLDLLSAVTHGGGFVLRPSHSAARPIGNRRPR